MRINKDVMAYYYGPFKINPNRQKYHGRFLISNKLIHSLREFQIRHYELGDYRPKFSIKKQNGVVDGRNYWYLTNADESPKYFNDYFMGVDAGFTKGMAEMITYWDGGLVEKSFVTPKDAMKIWGYKPDQFVYSNYGTS